MSAEKLGQSHDKVVIPIAGAINMKLQTPHLPWANVVSTATVHFNELSKTFKSEGSWDFEEPLVLPRLGIQPIEKTHKNIYDLVERKLDKYPDNVQAVLVGHSLGGLSVARLCQNTGDSRIAGGITVDSPHRGKFSGPIGGMTELLMRRLINSEEFSDETARLAEEAQKSDNHPKLTMTATSSKFVTSSSALPDYVGARRVLFVPWSQESEDVNDGIERIAGPNLGHMSILTHGVATAGLLRLASDIVRPNT